MPDDHAVVHAAEATPAVRPAECREVSRWRR